MSGAANIILIALVTLPVAGGIPLAILAYLDFRKHDRRRHVSLREVTP